MSEVVLRPCPALPHTPLRAQDGSFVLEALPEGRLIQALASPCADAADLAARLSDLAGPEPFAVRPFAPGQWLVVGDVPLVPGELARAAFALGPDLALADQGHGRVRLAIEGSRARDGLARGTGIDLAAETFAVGRSAQTLFGHVGVHVTRVAADRFELVVLRSLAKFLWEELTEVGAADPQRLADGT